ncbi:MAG: hypothetical protein DRO11_10415, partial [Methanobacteriota archaeon]
MSWAKKQIDCGADAIWIDMLFSQAGRLLRITKDPNHPAVRESFEAASEMVDKIHEYGLSKGRYIYVGTWDQPIISMPYSPPDLDFVTLANIPSSREVYLMELDEGKCDERIEKIREKLGDVYILAFMDFGFPNSPVEIFSQNLTPEKQREFLRIADEFFSKKGIIFIYPVHGGFMGWNPKILSFGKFNVYDSLAPEFDTYETIKELAQKKKVKPEPVEVKVEIICTDRIDNDADGLVDKEDGDCWIREGATFCEELILETTRFNDLADMIPILKDVGVELIELVPIWEHCNSFAPGLRWQVRNYERLDPARGTEEDLFNFLNKAHAAGLKVITMFQIATTTPPSPICRGRVAPWARTIDYDREGIGGYLYQYQIADEEKDILVRNLDGEYACEFNGFGLVVNPQSDNVIRIFKELYEREINRRGFDGLRLDHPAISYCFSGDTIWHGCEQYPCPDPAVPGNYSPLRLYRTLTDIKKPDQIFTSEDPCTRPWISDWACNYPHYRPFTDMDEVADISEDYVFTLIILRRYILNNKLSSDEFVKWLNNEPISYARTRYRMWRNWNFFDFPTINFILNDPRYFPTVTLLCTIPGVPKVTQWEIIEEPPEELLDRLGIKKIKFPVKDRRAHWKKVLNIRNKNDALKYGSISNVWKSGDSIFAYLRSYEDEKVIVVINFLNKTAVST